MLRCFSSQLQATCKVNAVNASARSSTAAEIDAIKPMATEADAKWLLETMCKPSTKEVRLAALAALDKSPKSCMRRFVQDGGLRILEKWLRKSPAARYACLQVLQKLPVSLPDLRQANIMPSVAMIQRSEAEEANGKQALALLERWRSLVQCSDEPPFKRPRQDEAPVAAAAPAPKAAAKAAAPVADPRPQTHAQAQPPQPRTPPLSQLPAAKSEDIPPELKNVDPRIALVLMENPDLLEFLKKQPGIFQNMSPQSLAFHRAFSCTQPPVKWLFFGAFPPPPPSLSFSFFNIVFFFPLSLSLSFFPKPEIIHCRLLSGGGHGRDAQAAT